MKSLIFLYAACLLASFSHASEPDKQLAEYWAGVLSANDFTAVLTVFQSGPKEQWPVVHSVDYVDDENKLLMAQEAEFRKLGEKLVHGLENYEQQLKDVSSDDFCERSESLLAMRQHLTRHPSYFNLILIDSINRILYVNLAERLARAENVPSCLLVLAEHLGEFRPNIEHLRTLAEAELGKSIVEKNRFDSVSDDERLKLLWSAIEPESVLMFPKNVLDIGTRQLIKKQDIPLLLNRLVFSDLYINSLLPALVLYRQEAKAYSPVDSYQQIQAVLGKNMRVMESLGARPFGVSRAAAAVNYLLQDIKSGKTRKLLFFSESEILDGGSR